MIGGAVGIRVSNNASNVTIAHDVVARTTQDAILVQDSSNVMIQSDTLYVPPPVSGPAANGVVVENASSSVALQNNIIWNESGFDIYVANDSQRGFASDYNNLFGSGTGMIAWWQTDFLDLYDWQTETLFDAHSIGYTTLDPTLDNPQFVDAASNDYQLTPMVSTSIAAGNPASDFSLQNPDTGGRIELGADGDTPLAAESQASFITIDAPNFYRDWLVSQSNTILWHSFGLPSGAVVLINLLDANGNFSQTLNPTDTAGNPIPVPASQGYLAWNPAASLSGSQYRIQVIVVNGPSVTAESREAFSLVSPTVTCFYVDDPTSFDSGGHQYVTAPGNNRQTGTTPADPKASLLALMGSYRLQPGDTVYVDQGTYAIVRNVVISGQLSLGGNEGFTLTGPTSAGLQAVFDRGNTNPGSYDFDINDAAYVTIENIALTDGVSGMFIEDGCDHDSIKGVTVSGNAGTGLLTDSTITNLTLTGVMASGNGGAGINSEAQSTTVTNSFVFNNQQGGLELNNGCVSGSTAYDNLETGISVSGSGNVSSNTVYSNGTGIAASGTVTVSGNTVSGCTSGTGIAVYGGATATRNVVYGNSTGIVLGNGFDSSARPATTGL